MGFTVGLTTRNGTPVPTPLRLLPVRYSWHERGGPEAAEITVQGVDDVEQVLDFVGCKVTIYAPDLTPVWWGIVEEATAAQDGLQHGVSLADMANRISVLYSIATDDGSAAAQTAWVEDPRSISLYGKKELRHSLGTATPSEAAAALTSLLAQLSMPQLTVAPSSSADGAAALHCIGFWQTLDWRYLAQSAGRIVHSGDNETEALLGWGIVGSDMVGFDARLDRIHELNAKFTTELQEGDRLAVTGSTSNNGAFTITEAPAVDKQVTYAGTVSFNPIDDIDDGGERLDQFGAGEMLRIQNATSNNGFWFLKSVAPDHATLHPETVVTESANPVNLTQGNSVAVAEALTHEVPAAGSKYVTVLAHGVKIAQSFAVPAGGAAWTPGEVVVKAKRLGNPADALKVEICADNAGVPGAVLDSGLATGSALPAQSLAAVSVSLARTASLTPGGTYWLVVSRTGAAEHANCYKIGMDKDGIISGGSLRLWTGAAWATRYLGGGLNFELWGHAATTAQLADLVAAVQDGGYVTASSIRTASGVYTRRYRDGQQSALAEAKKLLQSGTVGGNRLIATVDRGGALIVQTATDTTLEQLKWQGGKIVNLWGKDLGQGVLPAGRWLKVRAPRLAGMLSSDMVMITKAEYDVAADKITPEFGRSAWDALGIQQG